MSAARAVALIGLLVAASLSACAGAPPVETPTPGAEVAAARQRWQAQRLAAYDYRVTIACMCIHRGTYDAQVREGRVVAARLPTGEAVAGESLERIPTVDALFEALRRAAGEGIPIRVEYHPRLGYPVVAEIGTLADDSGTLYRIESLDPP